MAVFNRRSTLLGALDDWRSRGLVDSGLHERLARDVAERLPPRNFTAIILMLGVISLAFGAMTFVAANWDQMSNLPRLVLLFAGLWASWIAAIVLRMRGHARAGELFVLLACAVFGASIMLISQIYQIQGEPRDAVWLWAVGSFLAAVLARSVPALALAILTITLWALMDVPLFSSDGVFEYTYPGYWLAAALAAWWMGSRFSAHLLMLGINIWLFVLVLNHTEQAGKLADITLMLWVLFAAEAAISMALFSLGSRRWLKGYKPAAIVHLFLLSAALIVLWYAATDQSWNGDWRLVQTSVWPGLAGAAATVALAVAGWMSTNRLLYDLIVTAVFAVIAATLAPSVHRLPFLMEGYMLTMSIWVIRMGWRLEYRALSTLGFLGFTGVMLLIYFRTLGTLMDTSLFYLGAGVLLVAGAVIVPRLARRFRPASAGSGSGVAP